LRYNAVTAQSFDTLEISHYWDGAGTIAMTIGVSLVHSGHESGNLLAAISVMVVAAMLLFGLLVFRREAVEQLAAHRTG
jgi:hypothetical protein